MNIEFESINDLYEKVKPALKYKKRELLKKNIKMNEKEIFNYLIKEKWLNSTDLSLNDIVNDIINFNNNLFIN